MQCGKLDTQIKNFYQKYYTTKPKEFLDIYEIILDKGFEVVENAVKEVEKISPLDITVDKVKVICNRRNNSDLSDNIFTDNIAIASYDLLAQYSVLIPKSSENFEKEGCIL